VPLVPLLRRRHWPEHSELLARFVAYGRTHGAWDDSRGYSEGSLGRVIEAAAGVSPVLPSLKADPDFLCGMEFDSLSAELAFFRRHGLDVEEVAIDIALGPGQLMLTACSASRKSIRSRGSGCDPARLAHVHWGSTSHSARGTGKPNRCRFGGRRATFTRPRATTTAPSNSEGDRISF
jgi:hypothetical protein